MTVSSPNNLVSSQGDGVNTTWPYQFRIPDVSYVRVYIQDRTTLISTLLSPSLYTITGVDPINAGGNVEYPLVGSPIDANTNLVIERIVPYTQDLDITNQDGFYPETVEQELDLVVMQIQQLAEVLDRTVTVPVGEDGITVVPGDEGQTVVFDAEGNLIPGNPVSGVLPGTADRMVVTNGAGLPTLITYDQGRANLGFPNPIVANTMLLANAGATAYESKTASEIQTFLGIATPVLPVANRTALKAVNRSVYQTVYLMEAGRRGIFNWVAGDQTANFAEDTLEGIFIKANSDAITVGAWVRDFAGPINVQWFGAVGDDTVQCQPAFQCALDMSMYIYQGRAVYAPSGVYRFNAGLVIDSGTTLYGDAVSPYRVYPGGVAATRGYGTWFHTTSAAASQILIQRPVGGRCTGTYFHSFGIFQDHPAPAAAWAPTNYPYSIKADSVDDVFCRDLVLLNVFAGIQMTGTLSFPAGRLRCQRIMGQPFAVGIDVDFSADVTILDDIHFWLFWTDHIDVRKWMRINGLCIRSARNDNAKFSNIFGFGYRTGLQVTGNASGVTQRMLANQMGFDDCSRPFHFTSAGAAGSGSFSDCYGAGNPVVVAGVPNADMMVIEGINYALRFSNLRLSNSHANGVFINAAGCVVYFVNCWTDTWNISAGGFAAINVAAGSFARLYNHLNTNGAGGAASGGAGSVTYV